MIELLLLLVLLSTAAFGVVLIAMGQTILAALAAQTQAITDLQSRVGGQSGITQTEADQILAGVQANTTVISSILT